MESIISKDMNVAMKKQNEDKENEAAINKATIKNWVHVVGSFFSVVIAVNELSKQNTNQSASVIYFNMAETVLFLLWIFVPLNKEWKKKNYKKISSIARVVSVLFQIALEYILDQDSFAQTEHHINTKRWIRLALRIFGSLIYKLYKLYCDRKRSHERELDELVA